MNSDVRRSCIVVLLTLFVIVHIPSNVFARVSSAQKDLLVNGDFEQGLVGWSDLWTRTSSGTLSLDAQQRHGGTQAARIELTRREDWALSQQRSLETKPGQIYELSGWVRVQGHGNTTLCVVLRDADDKVIDWAFGGQTVGATGGWRSLRSRFIVPPGSKILQMRLIGYGPATVWFDDAKLVLQGSVDEMRRKDLGASLTANNEFLDVVFYTADGTLSITDRRCERRWTQWSRRPIVVLDAEAVESGFQATLLDPATMLRLEVTIHLEPQRPEITLEVSAKGEMPQDIGFPQPLTTDKETCLILPVNEGISYPAGDQTIESAYYYLYGGHGLCMAWFGQTDGRQGVMTLVETPDDAAVRMERRDGLLSLSPEWEPQKGQFGYARRLRWVFFDDGGYVAMCKRYRQNVKETGLFKTLAEKRRENPSVDLLVGAVNVWCWDKEAVTICRELQAAGIRRILWSNGTDPETLRRLNAMGVLTSRYDIYQDVMDPATFPKLRWISHDWTTGGWPKDLMRDSQGQWLPGWEVEGKDDRLYPCGVLCDRRAPEYARQRIAEELKTHAYRCRFIDTTTAAPWRECYDTAHPLTRSQSRYWKMELLKYVSQGCHLVTGSETGHEAAVPYVHYFEGMLSLGPYRVPDAGRDMARVWDEVPKSLAKFQTGHFYRLPLWELVYHDCVVAQWYWGDYNNKLPKVWDRRDLVNALYGTPPMFMFDRKLWHERQERFVRSYRIAAENARTTGYAEMLSHRWLTADHSVQETRFAGGSTVTVNFGDQPYKLADGTELPPLSHRVVK